MGVAPLSEREKAYFNTIRDKAPEHGALSLVRMLLDGREVAVIGTDVFNRFTGKREGWMPLAVVADDELTARLRNLDGAGPSSTSPHDLDPNR